MGDRNNPIKFGPEWLRNLSRERTAGASANNSQNTASSSGATSSGAAAGSSGGASNAAAAASNTNTNSPKVQLAKLRYGREEMLALYDRTSEAPQELKYIDILYQPRGKPPVALNNSFEEDMRDAMRSGPPIGGMASGERFGIGRGMGRGMNLTEVRGRPRLPFVRQLSTGRGTTSWHAGSPRMPGYSGGPEDEASPPMRSWNNNSNGGNAAARSAGDQPDWTSNKMYRSKRPGANTNWRSTREEEEWRAADNNRARPPQDKWDRDWGDNRPAHRRTWVGGDSQNSDDNLPEWAVENAEACGGTFDSSGAFHGYSNDDSNLPKSQESAYALTRSHTHGSFVRSKTAEEGSEEWWASEKAKKLSPKRFDASEIKFNKKPNAVIPELSSGPKSNNKEESPTAKELEKPESPSAGDLPENNAGNADDNFNKKSVRFAESKTFDALMRSDINMEEAGDERGNFQSVMITPNNSLRQKHQNIVQSANNNNRQSRKPGILQMIQNQNAQNQQQTPDSELSQHQNPEDKIVEEIMDMALEDKAIISKLTSANDIMMPNSSASAIMSSAMSTVVNSVTHMTSPGMQLRMSSPIQPLQGLAINPKSSLATPGMQAAGLQTQGLQQVGITNSALNASLGLPLGPNSSPMAQTMGLPLQNVPPPVLPNQGMGSAGLQPGQLPSFQPGGGLSGMSGANVVNSSLFLGQNNSNASLQSTSDMQINHGNQNMFPMHGLQHSGSQAAFNSSIYGNIMQQSPATNQQSANQALTEQWYYEDPKKNIQGPFSSKEMYSWYRAGFFSSSLMVRRACDAVMRPLGSYGPVVPFAQMDHMMSPFPMGSGFEPRGQGPHESLLNSQQGLGLDVMNMSEQSSMDAMQFGSVGIIRNPPFGQQQMVESLWSQPSPSPDLLWMQQAMNARNEARVNNLSVFFWDQQPSSMASNPLLPDGLPKEMKTEDEILAQLRASQNLNASQKMPFSNEQPPQPQGPPPVKSDDPFPSNINMAPNLEDLQKLIQEESLKDIPLPPETEKENFIDLAQIKKMRENDKAAAEAVQAQAVQNKQAATAETKAAKQAKNESEKAPKIKESAKTKNSKKPKEEKKDESNDTKTQDDNSKVEKRSEEASPSKSKKEEKINKKELEKEKNQWIKEGFTIVKTEKNTKNGKTKTDEIKVVEDAELKRKEEERLAAEEEKRKRQAELLRRQQELQQQQQQRQAAESVAKKAPWSAVSAQSAHAPNKDGLTLAEIQRLEREKKLEQMREQQQMMQMIAQQQAAALAREQEMQAGLGWAKKKANAPSPGKSLIEIQAEARKQAVAAAAAAAAAASHAFEEQVAAPPPVNHIPWGSPYNGGFWDTQPAPVQKAPEPPKPVEPKQPKKKQPQPTPQPQPQHPPAASTLVKKEVTPAADFECWCTTVLASWSAKIDVPTFVGFLRDIESPYEVKDYVKCYLGDTKDSNDFARQFLERRSRLLRVGMVTPSDDLCSPAMAINPRTTSCSDYQEVKSKGKKTKKNKMMKVDAARLLGFSVTAAEDRINVGDIDTV